MLLSAPLLDQLFPESGLGLGEPRALLPKTPKLITVVDVALQNSGAATQPPLSHILAAAWLPVGLWSNKSPYFQERGVSKGGGQRGRGGPIIQILWVRRGPGEPAGWGWGMLRCCWTGPKSSGSMRVIEASTHCVGLFLAQQTEQEFRGPSQDLFASVRAHQGEDQQCAARVQQHPPCPFWDLVSARLWCTPRPSPLQRPVGTVPPPPEAWSCEHMDTHGHMVGIQHRRGDGLWGMKGLFGKSPDPALNVQGL